MSNFPYSVSLAVPVADRDDGNRLAVALGWDQAPGSTFGVPLSAHGRAPATHYGCHAWAGPEFIATLSGAQGGSLPDVAWADFGLTAERVGELMASMLSHVQTGSVGFQALMGAQDLQVVNP
jgi:hypothetical protein